MMKILNIFKKIIKWSLIGIAVIILLILVINAFDEKPYKEIEEYGRVKEADVKDEENGYYIHLMFYAPAGDDPHIRGIEMVKKINSIILSGNPHSLDSEIDEAINKHSLKVIGESGKISNISLSVYDANTKEIQKVIDDNRVMIERYLSLSSYPHYKETALPSLASPLPPSLLDVHSLQLANIIMTYRNGRRGEALSLLNQDILFWRNIMKVAGNHFTKTISIRHIMSDIRLLSEIIGEMPADKDVIRIADKMLAPLTTDERSYDISRRRWFVVLRNDIKWIMTDWSRIINGEESYKNILIYLLRPFFKPNATLNAVYRYNLALGKIENLSGKEVVLHINERPVQANPEISWNLIYNPVGKIMFSFAYEPITDPRSKNVHNLDGLMKLVSLKLRLKENAVKENDVEGYIKESGKDYANPYTGETMKWDAKKRTIYFNGMKNDGQLNEVIETTL